MTRSGFFKVLIAYQGMKWIGLFTMLLGIGILLAIFIDWEIIILAMMVLFLVVPMVVMFLYFFHALKPLTLLNTSPHRFERDENGLKILMTETEREVTVGYEKLKLYSDFDKGFIFTADSEGWVWIGEIFFDSKEEFSKFITELTEKINEGNTR